MMEGNTSCAIYEFEFNLEDEYFHKHMTIIYLATLTEMPTSNYCFV